MQSKAKLKLSNLGDQPGAGIWETSPFWLDLLFFDLPGREGEEIGRPARAGHLLSNLCGEERERSAGDQPGLETIARYLKSESKNPLSNA